MAMGGCWVVDAVPSTTFTPQEHCVELLRVIFSRNTIPILLHSHEKPFLILMLIREYGGSQIRSKKSYGLLVLAEDQQIQPWSDFLTRSTNLQVEDGRDIGGFHDEGAVIVTTHSRMSSLPEDIQSRVSLVVIDNGHIMSNYENVAKDFKDSRIVIFTANLFHETSSTTLKAVKGRIKRLERRFQLPVETTCDILTVLRYVSKPRLGVLTYTSVAKSSKLETKIEETLLQFKSFLENHHFSLLETYGEDFKDLITDIPDPVTLPLKLIDRFLMILKTCGAWCAERAALLLTIKIDKLKTREKYERHYLLLSVLYTEMLKIRKFCDDAFSDLSEREKLSRFSTPKLKRVMEILLRYKPDHVTDENDEDNHPSNNQNKFYSRKKRIYNYDDPNALCGVIFVKDKFVAKILYHFLKDYSRADHKFSFLMPQYAVDEESNEGAEEGDDVNSHRKQEEALRQFRMRECNVLISNSLLEVGIDCVRCNMILAFDPPSTFHTWAHYKVKAKAASMPCWFLSLCHEDELESYLELMSKYGSVEKLLIQHCRFSDPDPKEQIQADFIQNSVLGIESSACTLKNSMLLLNRYCAKLPSDTFTRLTPLTATLPLESGFVCGIQLPINCPLKTLVVGPVMPNVTLARRTAALRACLELRKIGELDSFMNPIGKDGTGYAAQMASRYIRNRARRYRGHFTKAEKQEGDKQEIIEVDVEDKKETLDLDLAKDKQEDSVEDVIDHKFDDVVEDKSGVNNEVEDKQEAAVETEDNYEIDETTSINDTLKAEIDKTVCEDKEVVDTVVEDKQDDIDETTVDTKKEVVDVEDKKEEIDEATVEDTQVAVIEVKQNNKNTVKGKQMVSFANKEFSSDATSKTHQQRLHNTHDSPRPGTTKRRQYYYKKVASCLKSPKETKLYRLYDLKMRLSCPIPDDQNTRGRKIYPPEDSHQGFGFLVRGSIPPICPFPIYTRSGEVMLEINLIQENLTLTEEETDLILNFHQYTFSKVLRLEKYPMQFSPHGESDNSILILPLLKSTDIDWRFLKRIREESDKKLSLISDEDRKDFVFDETDYLDAVIMPWYRNQDQPQYFYVAEICEHLNPSSDFPGQGFESFAKYYSSKYNIQIQNLEQPLLDVDHTSHRLNFLTPRYVNRKGIALPTSSEETKRNKRENLEQKQILVPELCCIHPFPASLWRQTVSLPCVLYRLNGLLIADDLRTLIAREMSLGIAELSSDFKWAPLDFGWTLSDVLKNRDNVPAITTHDHPKKNKKILNSVTAAITLEKTPTPVVSKSKTDLTSLTDELINKMNEEESKLKKKQLEIGMWSNEIAKEEFRRHHNGYGDGEDEVDEEEFAEFLDPNVALPDNLTILRNDILPENSHLVGGSKDWGMGIQQKHFRVGSPTFFSNPNINIPGMMDDLDGLSCSDSDDYDYYDDDDGDNDYCNDEYSGTTKYPMLKSKDDGSVRIEFRGEHMAEAIEDENDEKKRVESLAKNREEEAKMLREIPWNEFEEKEGDYDEVDDKEEENEKGLKVVIFDNESTFDRFYVSSRDSIDNYNPISMEGFSLAEFDLEENHQLFFQRELNLDAEKARSVRETYIDDGVPPGVIPRDGDSEMTFSFDYQPDLTLHPGPSPSLILQGLTMSNSNDAINLERLETIGDSFLKYAITSYLFNAYDTVHEGRLSHLRSKQVSNLNLFKLGRKKRLGECMIATKFEPHDNWLPPSYHVPLELEQALIQSGVPASHWNMADFPSVDLKTMTTQQICALFKSNPVESIQDLPSFVPYNLLTQHSIPDKSIADCVEALIGAYLISCGQRGALLFMTWLGLKVIKDDKEDDDEATSSRLHPLPVLEPELQLNYFLSGYEEFEALIGYKFRDRSFLLQAFSHASFYPNRLTDCYQRLEFLGDAILDYLITRHLYEDSRQHSPGALTDLRSALVNNTIFAFLAVKFQFHKYFKHFSPGLQTVIDRFVKIQVQNEFKVFDEFYLIEASLEDDAYEEAEDVEVPKALGDIFESVAGAIFLDSGLSLDAVWKIYFRMMKPEIEQFSSNVPKSPIRELLELEPETAKFGKPEKLADGKRVRVSVEVFGKGVFKGIGRNYRIAKCTAAKCALRALKKSLK